MSLNQFQSALAYLIRIPEPGQRMDIEQIFLKYELSSEEQTLLRHLANHRLVKAYGDDMLDARWRIINRVVDCLYPLVSNELLKQLCREDFEPKFFGTSFLDINTKFLEYLIEDSYARARVLDGAPPYLLDTMRYAYTVYYFSKGALPEPPKIPAQSLLRHSYFRILELDYDIRELCDELFNARDPKKTNDVITVEETPTEEIFISSQDSLPVPEKCPLILLFIADETPTEFRSFEIDNELRNFLNCELEAPQSRSSLPPCYGDLVELGLCQNQGKAWSIVEASCDADLMV
jgi:hypothetical protein